jgi:N-acetyl-gamma-glutamyl-phosphate reductase
VTPTAQLEEKKKPGAPGSASGTRAATSAPKSTLRTAIAGVTGYAGAELARLLLEHPRLANTPPMLLGRANASSTEPTTLTQLHPQLSHLPHADELTLVPFDFTEPALKALAREQIDILFLATPHEESRAWAPIALNHGLRVIDLSGAWRLHNDANRAVYKLTDSDPAAAQKLQHEAVYGSPEIHAAQIKSARLVANPGCYATSIILALAPLVRANVLDLAHGIVCDAKSGVSGAGKTPSANTHFMHAADNLSAYNVFGHRHIGEMLEQLTLDTTHLQFTPHLLPIPRGILSTLYVRLAEPSTPERIQTLFETFFADAPMVRVRPTPMLPQIQHVVRTSFCDIGFHLAPDRKRLVLVSCLDNLLKGAASQAVQNMNLMAGFHESEGLK